MKRLIVVLLFLPLLLLVSAFSITSQIQEKECVVGIASEQVQPPEALLFIPQEFMGNDGLEVVLGKRDVCERINEVIALSQQTGQTFQYYGCKGCIDLACADSDHFHWCPGVCNKPDHYHARYTWKQFQ